MAGQAGWIARRTKPSRRQAKNLTAFERATGWRYSVIVTNIPAAGGTGGVPGSHHAQFIDVLHREHAVVEDQVRTNKAMGLRNLLSKTRAVNCGWVLAANIAADLSAWCQAASIACDLLAWLRLLALDGDLAKAEPKTLRYKILHTAGRIARGQRRRHLKIPSSWPWAHHIADAFTRIMALPPP